MCNGVRLTTKCVIELKCSSNDTGFGHFFQTYIPKNEEADCSNEAECVASNFFPPLFLQHKCADECPALQQCPLESRFSEIMAINNFELMEKLKADAQTKYRVKMLQKWLGFWEG